MTETNNISSTPRDKRFVDVTRNQDYVLIFVPLPYINRQFTCEVPMLLGSNNFRGSFS